VLKQFELLKGFWYGKKTIWESPKVEPVICPIIAMVESKKGGEYFSIPYFWRLKDNSQSGLFSIIKKGANNAFECVWSDSWHNPEHDLKLTGALYADTFFSFLGQYCLNNNNRSWKIKITSHTRDVIQFLMYNISPSDEEFLAVDIQIHQVKESNYLQKKEKYHL
jgi:hypothetical protein